MLEEKSDGASAQLTEASQFIFAKGSNGDFANAAAKTLKKSDQRHRCNTYVFF